MAFERSTDSTLECNATVLFVHDEFGESTIDALAEEGAIPRKWLIALRCRQMPDGSGALDWARLDKAGRWISLATSTIEQCDSVAELLVRDALEAIECTRVDIFLLSDTKVSNDNIRSRLAKAIRRLHPLLSGAEWICAVIAADIRNAPVIGAKRDEKDGLTATIDNLLERNSFDYVFLTESSDHGLSITDQSQVRHLRAAQAAANTISILTHGALAKTLRKKLSFGQFDSARRTVALGLASMSVEESTIRRQLRLHICRRLVGMVLEHIRKPTASDMDPDCQTREQFEEQIASTEWDLAKLKRLLAKYHEFVTARDDALLQELIRDAGRAAHAMALLHRGPRITLPPSAPRSSRWRSSMGILGGLLALGSAGLAALQVVVLAVALPAAVLVPIFMAGVLILAGAAWRRPPRPQAEPSHDSPLDAYRKVQREHQMVRQQMAKIASWTRNADRAVTTLEIALQDDRPHDPAAVTLPSAVCERVLRARNVGISSLFEAFMDECGVAGRLLICDDCDAALRSIESFADRPLSEIDSVDWSSLAAFLAGQSDRDLDGTWLGNIIHNIRRISTPPAYGSVSPSWEILAVPADTPDVVIAKLRATPSRRSEVILADVRALISVQTMEGIRVGSSAPEVSPV